MQHVSGTLSSCEVTSLEASEGNTCTPLAGRGLTAALRAGRPRPARPYTIKQNYPFRALDHDSCQVSVAYNLNS